MTGGFLLAHYGRACRVIAWLEGRAAAGDHPQLRAWLAAERRYVADLAALGIEERAIELVEDEARRVVALLVAFEEALRNG